MPEEACDNVLLKGKRIMKQEQDHDESEPLPQTNGNNDDALGSSLSCSSEDDDQASSDPKAQRKKNYRPGGVAGEKTIVVKVKPNTATIFPPTPQQQTITRVLRRPRLASAASPRNRKLADEFSDSPSGGTDGGGAPAKKRVRRETLPDIAERIPVDALRPYLKMSLVSAAKAMSISATTLKRLCRHYGIKRWPFRQISGIDRTVHRLEAELQASLQRSPNGTMVNPIAAHIRELHAHRQGMVELALEGGHEPIRGKLAAVDAFVNNIYGSREPSTNSGTPSLPTVPENHPTGEGNHGPPLSPPFASSNGYFGILSSMGKGGGNGNTAPDNATQNVFYPMTPEVKHLPYYGGIVNDGDYFPGDHHVPIVSREMPAPGMPGSFAHRITGSGRTPPPPSPTLAEAVAAAAAAVAVESKAAVSDAAGRPMADEQIRRQYHRGGGSDGGVLSLSQDLGSLTNLSSIEVVGDGGGGGDISSAAAIVPPPSGSTFGSNSSPLSLVLPHIRDNLPRTSELGGRLANSSDGGRAEGGYNSGGGGGVGGGRFGGSNCVRNYREVVTVERSRKILREWSVVPAAYDGERKQQQGGAIAESPVGHAQPSSRGRDYSSYIYHHQQQQQHDQRQRLQRYPPHHHHHDHNQQQQQNFQEPRHHQVPLTSLEWSHGGFAVSNKNSTSPGEDFELPVAAVASESMRPVGPVGVHNYGGGRGGGHARDGGGGGGSIDMSAEDVKTLGELVFGNTELYDAATAAHEASRNAMGYSGDGSSKVNRAGYGSGGGRWASSNSNEINTNPEMAASMWRGMGSTWRPRVSDMGRPPSACLQEPSQFSYGGGIGMF